jgi:ABC-type sugar transport system substrate-binding protein
MKKRTKGLLLVLLMFVCMLPVFGGGETESTATSEEGAYLFGLSVKIVSNTWEAFFEKSFQWYCEDNGYGWISNQAQGDPATQVSQAVQMIDMVGVDGLIVAAQDKDASRPIVDAADAAGIPVFTCDADIDHPGVKMYIGFSGFRGGQILGEQLVEYLKNEVDPVGKVQGVVLEMLGPLGGASAIDRSEGFHDIIDQYPDVQILQAVGEFQEAPAKVEAEAILLANPNVDAVYSANGPMAVGAVEAMKSLGIDPTTVFVATMDANPEVLDRIKSGEIEVCLDQPCPFYNPIAVYYMAKYLEEGDAGLPEVGDIITTDDLKLSTGVEHLGSDIWANDSAWAPAEIKMQNGHLWFQTGAIVVTKENADAGYLWANAEIPGW